MLKLAMVRFPLEITHNTNVLQTVGLPILGYIKNYIVVMMAVLMILLLLGQSVDLLCAVKMIYPFQMKIRI